MATALVRRHFSFLDEHSAEQHLRATEKYFPEEAQDWFKKHSTSPGYALRYDDEILEGIAKMTKLPVIRLWPEQESYLLVYELGPIAMVQLAAYQAISLGEIEPMMLDVVLSDYFPFVARDVMGLETLNVASRRLYRVGMEFETGSKAHPRPRQKPSQTPNGKRPTGYYMYGPNKGKPFYGPEEG